MIKKLLASAAVASLTWSSVSGADTALVEPHILAMIEAGQPMEMEYNIKASAWVLILPITGKANFRVTMNKDTYAIRSLVKTTGLADILVNYDLEFAASGYTSPEGLDTYAFVSQNKDGKKNRRVEMDYNYDTREVAVDIHPPLGSQGVPPASMEERFEADDTITTILAMMMRGTRIDGELCKGTIPVFDSKQHYGLRMVRLGPKKVKYNGKKVMGVKCHVFYEPISGFDPEDLPEEEESSTPINVYFAKDETANLYVPVEFAYKISGFKAKIKLSDMRIALGGNAAETADAMQTD